MKTLSPNGKMEVRRAVRAAVAKAADAEGCATVAARLGVTRQSVMSWQQNRCWPSFPMAARLCPMLGIDPETGRSKP